jgi:hypothetical protein
MVGLRLDDATLRPMPNGFADEVLAINQMNRISHIFLNSNEHDSEAFVTDVVLRNTKLTQEEIDSLILAMSTLGNENGEHRLAWKMIVCSSIVETKLCELALDELERFQFKESSTGYENAIDLKLQYALYFSTVQDEVFNKFLSIPLGNLRLIIAEFYFSKHDENSGLLALVGALVCANNGRSTSDSIDLWLGEIASLETHETLKKLHTTAQKNHEDSRLFSALQYAIDQTLG